MEFTERNSHYAMTQGAIKTLPQKLCNLCAIASLRWIFTIMPHQPTKDENLGKNFATFAPLRLCVGSLQS